MSWLDDLRDRIAPRGASGSSGTGGGNAGRFDNDQYAEYRRAISRSVGAPTSGGNYTPIPNTYTKEGQNAYLAQRRGMSSVGMGSAPATSSGGGGGGGYGRGGGGGGGGGSGVTQAMIDAMARALGARMPQLQLQQAVMPKVQLANLPAFNGGVYDLANNQITAARAADQAVNQQALANTQAQLGQWQNSYAGVQVQPGQQMPQVGAGLMGTTGGVSNPAAAQQATAGDANNQAAFQNLLGVLSAAASQGQQSRQSEAVMNQGYADQALQAQTTGLLGQVAMGRTQAQNQWATQDADRRYQNSLMQQQWARDDATRRQETANTVRTTNYQGAVSQRQNALQPILDLIAQSGKTPGLDLTKLLAVLGTR